MGPVNQTGYANSSKLAILAKSRKGKHVLEEICLDEAHMPWFMSMILNRIKGNHHMHIAEDSEMARDFFYLRLS